MKVDRMVGNSEPKITIYFDGVNVEVKIDKFNIKKVNIDIYITSVLKSNADPSGRAV
jgi:hypothetical protein